MEKEREKRGFSTDTLSGIFSLGKEAGKKSPKTLLLDVGAVLAGLLFVRAPLFFGAHPFAAGFLGALPGCVWFALLGTLLGAISLGEGGIIYAMSSLIIVFLRVIISGAGKRAEEARLFGEGILLRMSVSVIGGFIAAVYEILLFGMSMTTVLFGLVMIIAPPLFAFCFSGVFGSRVDVFSLFSSDGALYRLKSEPWGLSYALSLLVLIFALSYSMREVSFLGISLSYLFCGAVTLISARRFGAIGGAAVGFVSAFAVSGTYSAAFMLAGFVSGAMGGFGILYSVVFGGVALSVFAAYVGGVTGLTGALPEYAAAGALCVPLLKKIKPYTTKNDAPSTDRAAIDMVGTMALAYKNTGRKTLRALNPLLCNLSAALGAFLTRMPSYEELSSLVFGVINKHLPYVEKDENLEKIATKLYKKEGISRQDLAYLGVSDGEIFSIFTDIKDMYDTLLLSCAPPSDEIRILGKIINEAVTCENGEYMMNEAATDTLEKALSSLGLSDFTVRVFGERKYHVILAGKDEDGALITAPHLREGLGRALDSVFDSPEYFRRGSMALMECSRQKRYSVSYASVGAVAEGSEVSGDVSRRIQTEDDMFYALISDGMGSGEIARKSSEFTAAFLCGVLALSPPSEPIMHLLNSYLCRGREECSVTVDLFSLDLYNREAMFIKSGGAPSYIKRGGSIFRIRSQTAPLGLMSSIDSEKIRVQIEAGDYIIMMSDGVSGVPEDAPWLLELISRTVPDSVSDFARAILDGAKRHHKSSDDMTVTVMRVDNLC